jgi:hypothetical protein
MVINLNFLFLSHLISLAAINSFHEDIQIHDSVDVLIIGDSQARQRGLGGALEDRLEENGLSVDRYTFPGWSTRSIYQFIVGDRGHSTYELIEDYSHYEYAFIMSGGNDSTPMLDECGMIIQHLMDNGVDKVFYMGPPDPTIIGSQNAAIANYPHLFNEDDFTNTYWFDIDRHTRRSRYRNQILFHAWTNGAYPIDFMYLANEWYDYDIPRYSDGIHVSYEAGYQFASMVIY